MTICLKPICSWKRNTVGLGAKMHYECFVAVLENTCLNMNLKMYFIGNKNGNMQESVSSNQLSLHYIKQVLKMWLSERLASFTPF